MTDAKKTNSVYFRTIITLTICTIFVFSVLCIVYYQRMSTSIISEESALLYERTKNAAIGFEAIREKNKEGSAESASLEETYLKATAISNNCYVWIVEEDFTISYYSGIPNEAIAQLGRTEDIYSMTSTHLNGLANILEGGVIKGTQNGLFYDPQNTWITAAFPISTDGQYLVTHEAIDVQKQALEVLSNTLAVPVIISFAIALFLFTMMTRSLIRPIRLLSAAAAKVTQGDLTARIHIPEFERESPVQFGITDELSEMVVTVNHMIERLEAQENERRVFVSSIAHDLRTPLTSIKGFISAMLDGTIAPDRFEYYLQIVKTEVDRIQTLSSSMTEVSSVGQKDNLKMAAFDINAMINSTLSNLEKQLSDKKLGVQLETYSDEDHALMAFGDDQEITRVVYNLLNNAIKFTPSGGDIAITADYNPKNNLVIVTVEDTGPGIPKEKRKRIFESFYKLDDSRNNPGSGLGLFICKEILQAHGQMISVDTSPTLGGARFKFTLQGADKMADATV